MKPLEGIKVVELGMFISAPGVARILCDWGAEVVKIEAPKGDNGRVASGQVGLPMEPDCDPIFSIINSGKKLVSLNLKSPEGMEIMHKLLSDADIFVSNTRQVLAELGYTPAQIEDMLRREVVSDRQIKP